MKRKVKRVVDGDTFETYRKVNGSNFVRIAGLNAPEKNQFGGRRSTNRLRGTIGGETVNVKPVGKSYGRTVAVVRKGRKNVGKKLG
jgi:endonuclease YncB( thermonuclease family)